MSAAPWWTDPAAVGRDEVLRLRAGALTPAERARLSELADRLRVVHDLTVAFADRYAAFPAGYAETQLREATLVRSLLGRYGIPPPAEPAARLPGRFGDPAVQREYDRLVERGGTGRAAAIRALTDALFRARSLLDRPPSGARAPDVHHAYRQLLAATARQLRGVQVWSPR
jgi:hypothetical protein